MIRVNHDFETFSEADLFKVGAHKYAMDPSTEVLMLAWAVDHETPQIWVPAEGGSPMPDELWHLVHSEDVEWHAFNAQFERLIWWHVLGVHIPIEKFRCTMQHAWSLSFSGGLAQVGAQLGLPADKRKNDRGKKLIQKFCKLAPSNHLADRYTHENAPEDWQEFKDYCVQDVISERGVEVLIEGYPMPQHEIDLWLWDQDVNDRGIPIDMELVNNAVKLEAEEKARLRVELKELTWMENANSNARLKEWLQLQGIQVPNMQKATLEKVIKNTTDDRVRWVLTAKLAISKTSATKWQAFQRATCDDGYLRGMFQFGGAQRTQRWAGRIVQLHNLKSPRIPAPDVAAEFINTDLATIRGLYGDPLTFLSETIRCAITAPEGYSLAPCDLGSIESRWLGYMSGCTRINLTFAEDRDTYKDFATEFYQIPYEDITKEQRTFCKPPVLGCGYQLGGPGLVRYADGMGVTMTEEEGAHGVEVWRGTYHEVPVMWKWLVEACKDVIDNFTVWEGYTVRIRRDSNFLFIDLPSGRSIHYYQPLVLPMIPPWEQAKVDAGEIELEDAQKMPTITYMGMNQYTKQWTRLTTHGGKITENIDQAACRDILAFHMLQIEKEFGPIIRGHVHDEAISLVPARDAADILVDCEDIMRISPPWAPTLLLDADGFITKRYKKEA